MEKHDWSNFTKRISIKAEQKEIFDYWTTQENLEKWFLSKAEFRNPSDVTKERFASIEAGDKYIWMWHGSDNVGEGEIIENNKKDFLKFSFLGCTVSVKIKKEEDENIVELIQSDIALDEASRVSYYVGCSRGWTFYLTNLKSILEGGIDLRNRNDKLIDVINT